MQCQVSLCARREDVATHSSRSSSDSAFGRSVEKRFTVGELPPACLRRALFDGGTKLRSVLVGALYALAEKLFSGAVRPLATRARTSSSNSLLTSIAMTPDYQSAPTVTDRRSDYQLRHGTTAPASGDHARVERSRRVIGYEERLDRAHCGSGEARGRWGLGAA